MPPTDLRVYFPAAQDQGKRGTCIAFGTTAAHEFLRFGQTGTVEPLSVEALHFGCKTIDGDRDSGTTFQSANQALSEVGQPPEAFWIYDKSRDEQRQDYLPPTQAIDPEFCFRTSFIAVSSELEGIIHVLERGIPVIAGIPLRASFHFAPAGRVSMPTPVEMFMGNHALLIVGWELDSEGMRWLIFRNSWGERWGDRGYGYLPTEYIERYGCQAYAFASF